MSRKLNVVSYLLLSSLLVPSFSVAAQEQDFPAVFFVDFAPQHALDVVQNIPGFRVDLGKDVRGLAGGAGNVLVDGIRVSAKSGGLEEVLKRIPFAQIEKVVVVRGNQGVGDASSQSIIANIIRKKVETTGQLSLSVHHDAGGKTYPQAEVSYASQIGDWQSNAKFDVLLQDNVQKSRYTQLDMNFDETSSEKEDKSTALNEIFASADLSKQQGDESLQLTMRAGKSQYRPALTRQHVGEDSQFKNDRNSIYHTAEVGADWRRPFTNWQWRTIGLAAFTHWTIDRSSSEFNGIAKSSEQYDFQRNKWESIIRNSWLKTEKERAIEFGFEVAYNHINVNTNYVKTDAQGQTSRVILPAANVEVSELRGDAFYSTQWQWQGGLSMSLGLAAEYSKITAEGDSESDEDYQFIKPSFNLSKQWHKHWQSQLTIDRTVNQLDFKLYAAQSNADTNRDHGGNTQLNPDSFYQLAIANDYQFTEQSALRLTAYYRWYQDVLEHQLSASGASSLVNSGDASAIGGKIVLTYSTDAYLPGGLLSATWQTQTSSHDDLLTGKSRRLTGETYPEAEISFRQDLASNNIAWGVTALLEDKTRYYYVDEVSTQNTDINWLGFVEYRGWRYGNLKLSFERLGDYHSDENRAFYLPDRTGEAHAYTHIKKVEQTLASLTFNTSF
ncbi:TonB-dependent receptor plug domain-containing protein [Thalassotalea marina]|uniref:TonB-dependent receptor plug domain-containing protein n=1 Tax=Thalassotalea marina TaxID=1673741 RepID=A0A919BAQ2_9GAMM|nr:TonB-dependent receptor plug domain-containing protein [Thalassotalea marina]GHF77866.1 hypothetical protein GCM10017161_01080 [Thalassotalea marina]